MQPTKTVYRRLPVIAILLSGCALSPFYTPHVERPAETEAMVVDQSVQKTYDEAKNALVAVGLPLTKASMTQDGSAAYVEGATPIVYPTPQRSIGGGGETIGIWIEADKDSKAKVLIAYDEYEIVKWNKKSYMSAITRELNSRLQRH